MKKLVITYGTQSRIEHIKYLIGALRGAGKWTGDIVLIAGGIIDCEQFKKKGVIVFENEYFNPNWAKLLDGGIFRKEILNNYDRVLYTDQDVVVYDEIERLFDQQGDFLSDDDSKTIAQEFTEEYNPECYKELKETYKINLSAFCCGVMRYDTRTLQTDIVRELEILRKRFASINGFVGVQNGWIDQSILNLYFSGRWKQLDKERFILKKEPDTVLCHCTNLYAPWNYTGGLGNNLEPAYKAGLKYFNEVL